MQNQQSKEEEASGAAIDALILRGGQSPEVIEPLVRHLLVMAAVHEASYMLPYVDRVHVLLDKWRERVEAAKAFQFFIRGLSAYYSTNFEDARRQLLLALDALPEKGAKDLEGIIRVLLGANYRSMGEMHLAVEHLLKSQALISKDGPFDIYHTIGLYQLGEVHIAIREYHNALHYYEQAEADMKPGILSPIAFRVYSGLAIGYMHVEQFDKSLDYMTRALSDSRISVRNLSRGWLDLGIIKSKQGLSEEAIVYFTQSYELRKANGLSDASSTSLIYLAKAYLETQRYNKALESLEEASFIIASFKSKSKQVQVYELLALTYKGLGDHERSVGYFERYMQLQQEEQAEQERRIFRYKNNLIEEQRKELEVKNKLLKETLDELAVAKRSRVAMAYSYFTVITLVILSELFFDPFIESHAYNTHISLCLKVIIALLLKPIDSLYESLLYKRAFEKRKQVD